MGQVKKQAKKSSISTTKQKSTKVRKPTNRQIKLAEGLAAGKSPRQAAKDAGYSAHTADHAERRVEALARSFKDIMREHIAPKDIAKVLKDGLKAVEVRPLIYEGELLEELKYPDHAERRACADLASRLAGYHNPKLLDLEHGPVEITVRRIGAKQ